MRINIIRKRSVILIVAILTTACDFSHKADRKGFITEETVTCKSNLAHSYEVFIDSGVQGKHSMPLLVLIDSRGDGEKAIRQFREAASKYGIVLVASNLIQNNDRLFMQELNELISDVKEEHNTINRIYLGGFSGGARMVLSYAANYHVDGVIFIKAICS